MYRVNHYFNKRFYKYTDEKFDCQHDISSLLEAPLKEGEKTLFVSEGCMLPSKTEVNMARMGRMELYSITNISFMEIAYHLKMIPNLYAVVRSSLAHRSEPLESFKSFNTFL